MEELFACTPDRAKRLRRLLWKWRQTVPELSDEDVLEELVSWGMFNKTWFGQYVPTWVFHQCISEERPSRLSRLICLDTLLFEDPTPATPKIAPNKPPRNISLTIWAYIGAYAPFFFSIRGGMPSLCWDAFLGASSPHSYLEEILLLCGGEPLVPKDEILEWAVALRAEGVRSLDLQRRLRNRLRAERKKLQEIAEEYPISPQTLATLRKP